MCVQFSGGPAARAGPGLESEQCPGTWHAGPWWVAFLQPAQWHQLAQEPPPPHIGGQSAGKILYILFCRQLNSCMTAHIKHGHRPIKHAKAKWEEKSPDIVPAASKKALRDAMKIEKVPDGDYQDLLWIMAQESAGKVGVRNHGSTAKGLFQLLHAQYSLNPNGEKSFGNAVEECQGGIRYIYGRYHTASNARAFWGRHHWY